MSARVTVDDLEWAIEWIESHEPLDEHRDEDAARQARLARWLRAEIERRYLGVARRQFARERAS